MNLPAENTNPHPLEIEDARAAEYAASESQRKHADALKGAHGTLAEAEYQYRTALTARIKRLKAAGWAATTCAEIARGEDDIAQLRKVRDEAEGEVARLADLSYTFGADRRALEKLIEWSMHRDLRTDSPPPGFDPRTGEIRG